MWEREERAGSGEGEGRERDDEIFFLTNCKTKSKISLGSFNMALTYHYRE